MNVYTRTGVLKRVCIY